LPPAHCASLVHRQGVPEAVHAPPGDVTSLQLPVEQKNAAAETSAWQLVWSAAPVPVHMPVHWSEALTHAPLEQSESATQRHAV